MKPFTSLIVVIAWAVSAPVHAQTKPGQILLLDKCPGDVQPAITATGDEALLQALLTPLLTGIVNSGLKLAGEKLKESAAEAQVDVLHVGSHFYQWRASPSDPNMKRWDTKYWCIVIASKRTKKTRTTLAELVTAYVTSHVDIRRDAKETSSIKGFTRQPVEEADEAGVVAKD